MALHVDGSWWTGEPGLRGRAGMCGQVGARPRVRGAGRERRRVCARVCVCPEASALPGLLAAPARGLPFPFPVASRFGRNWGSLLPAEPPAPSFHSPRLSLAGFRLPRPGGAGAGQVCPTAQQAPRTAHRPERSRVHWGQDPLPTPESSWEEKHGEVGAVRVGWGGDSFSGITRLEAPTLSMQRAGLAAGWQRGLGPALAQPGLTTR